MKLQKTTYKNGFDSDVLRAIWSPSKKSAATTRKELRKNSYTNIVTTDVNVPTMKENLVKFLNSQATISAVE